MRHYFALFLLIPILFFFACKKKEIKPTTPKEPVELASDYLPLKVGNYWIYEQFETDTNNNVKSLHIFDSVYVQGETNINGKTYMIVCDQDNYYPVADSLHYYYFDNDKLIDQTGSILLSTTNFTSVFNYSSVIYGSIDTIYTATSRMDDRNLKTTVKGGVFTTITCKTIFKNYNHFCRLIDYFPIHEKRYSLNIGVVYQNMLGYCEVPKLHHRELVRYHVN